MTENYFPVQPIESTNVQHYIKIARKQGLPQLKFVIAQLNDRAAVVAAKEAYIYYEGVINSRIKK